MTDRGGWRMIVAVERHTAAIIQEEAMQTSPISTEMSARFTSTTWRARRKCTERRAAFCKAPGAIGKTKPCRPAP